MFFKIDRTELDKFIANTKFYKEVKKVNKLYRQELNKISLRLEELQKRKEQLNENLAKTLAEKEPFKDNIDELLYYTDMANDIAKQAKTIDFAIEEAQEDLTAIKETYFKQYKQALSKDFDEIRKAINPAVSETVEMFRYELLTAIADIHNHISNQFPQEERDTFYTVVFDEKLKKKDYRSSFANSVVPEMMFDNNRLQVTAANYFGARQGHVNVTNPNKNGGEE